MNSKFLRAYTGAALFALAALSFGSARADSLTIDINDFASNGPDTAGNVVQKYLLSPYAAVTEIDWNVKLTAYEGNTLDQMFMSISGNLGGGVSLEPGYGDAFSGTKIYSGGVDLVASDIVFLANGSGSVDVEFWNYLDNIDGADGMWDSGTVTITYTPEAAAVPEPASGVLMLAGLAGAAALARKRRSGVALARAA